MSKTRKAYRLAQRVKYEDTKPERVVQSIVYYELGHHWSNEPIEVFDSERDGFVVFTPDLVISSVSGSSTDNMVPFDPITKHTIIEVDGPYHDTPIQQRKAKWRDGLLTKAGYRIIHVDAELTKNKAYQTYLKDKLVLAINSPEKVIHIDA